MKKYALLYKKTIYSYKDGIVNYRIVPYDIVEVIEDKEKKYIEVVDNKEVGKIYNYTSREFYMNENDYCYNEVFTKEEIIENAKKIDDRLNDLDLAIIVLLSKKSKEYYELNYNIKNSHLDIEKKYKKDEVALSNKYYYFTIDELMNFAKMENLINTKAKIKEITTNEKLQLQRKKDDKNLLPINEIYINDLLSTDNIRIIRQYYFNILVNISINGRSYFDNINNIDSFINKSYKNFFIDSLLVIYENIMKTDDIKIIKKELSLSAKIFNDQKNELVKYRKAVKIPKTYIEFIVSTGTLVKNLSNIDDVKQIKERLKLYYDSNKTSVLNSLDKMYGVTSEELNERRKKRIAKMEEENDMYKDLPKEISEVLRIYDIRFKMNRILNELDEKLVGLEDIKTYIKELGESRCVELLKKALGKGDIEDKNLNLLFTGNPGTGKTTVARMLAEIYYELGYLKENKFAELTSKDFISEHVGGSAPQTAKVIAENRGGLIFVDEAYGLCQGKDEHKFAAQSLSEFMKEMETKETIFIFAGYKKEMRDFMDMNSGLESRFDREIYFKDYTTDQLIEMFKRKVEKEGYEIDDSVINKVRIIIDKAKTNKNFGNGRFINKLFDNTNIKHNSDIFKDINERIMNSNLTVESYEKIKNELLNGNLEAVNGLLSINDLTEGINLFTITDENVHDEISKELVLEVTKKSPMGFSM